MDFQSVLDHLSGPGRENKYFYSEPEIQAQRDAVEKLKMGGFSQMVVDAQEKRLADMEAKKQQPVDKAEMSKNLDFLAPQASQNAVQGTPDMSLKAPSANATPSSYDVAISDTTVPMNGRIDSTMPVTPPNLMPEPPMPDPNMPPAVPAPQASGAGKPPAPTPGSMAGKSVKDLTSMAGLENGDQAKREQFERDEYKNKLKSLFPQLLAGAGDVITASGAPYGTKPTDALDKVVKIGKDEEKTRKEDLEKGFLNDPNSGMSKVAQNAAARLLGKKPEELSSLSLAQINKAFPIWKDALKNEEAKELKQMQLDYLRSSKKASSDAQMGQEQDRLEKQQRDRMDKITSNRSGGLGLQDAKVNQSLHLLSLMDQYKDAHGNYRIPPAQYEELAIGLANLISGSTTATDSMIKGIKQKTAQGDLAGALTYVTGKNFSGSSNDIFTNLRHTLERQGTIAEQQRDKYMKDFADTSPKELAADRLSRLTSVDRGNSVKKYLEDSGATGSGSQPVIMKDPKTGKRYQVDPTTKKVLKEI